MVLWRHGGRYMRILRSESRRTRRAGKPVGVRVRATPSRSRPNSRRDSRASRRRSVEMDDCGGAQKARRSKAAGVTPSERSIVARVIDAARALGWWATKIHGNAFQLAGLPDVLCIKDGRARWIECKRPGEEPTKLQSHRMRELADAGCRVAVVRSAADARVFLENIV